MVSNQIKGEPPMLAELHGKLSANGSFTDRLEDQLTGDIFGALRYLPFELGMGPLLSASSLPALRAYLERHGPQGYWADRFHFWPRHPLGELDALLELDGALVGIEVKYRSGLSSGDQLEREGAILRDLAGQSRKAVLVFMAGEDACVELCQGVTLSSGVPLAWVSWQRILTVFEGISTNNPFQRQILRDMSALLRRKGFDRFQGFPLQGPAVRRGAFFSYQWNRAGFSFPTSPYIQGGNFYVYR